MKAVFDCVPARPLPAITLTFTVAKSINNITRLCYVMSRCIQDMESLLETVPGAVVSRYISREALKLATIVEVGFSKSKFCPNEGGPSFHIQPEGRGPTGIDEGVLSSLKDGEPIMLVMSILVVVC